MCSTARPSGFPNPKWRHAAGFGATLQCWEPQLEQLLQPRRGGLTRVLLMDNRGVGRSGSPEDKRQYTTSLMAQDVLGILVRFHL